MEQRLSRACSVRMEARRPFTDPISVSLAGLAILALALASFATGLVRTLQLPRAVETANVVVMPPSDAPPPLPRPALAQLEPALAPKPRPKLAPPTEPTEAAPEPPQFAAPPPSLPPAPMSPSTAEVADDAAATGLTTATPAQPPPQEDTPAEAAP